jgi:pimeloyl-ACP methyl ester carboxylesterase
MPVIIIAILLVELLSLALLFIDYKLWREWYEFRNTAADDYATRCLYGAIALLVYSLSGKYLVTLLLSKIKRKDEGPTSVSSSKSSLIKRPDGSTIYIEEFGNPSGQPIIFVHGWNANRTEWFYQRRHFEKKFRIILFDLPGLGKSTRATNKDFSLSKMAKDLNAVIEHTGAKNPILWGHSIGGMTILTLVAKHRNILREKVRALILQHTTYTNPVKTSILNRLLTAIQKPVLQPICYIMIALSPLIWIMRWISYLNGNAHIMTRLLTFTGTQTPRQLNYITLLSTLAPPAVTARGLLGMFKYDVTNELPQIDIPTLIIAANKDRLTKPVASGYMQTHIPNAKLFTINPAGHQGLVERHHEANEAAESFLQKISEVESRAVNREPSNVRRQW